MSSPVHDFEGAPIVGVAATLYEDPEEVRFGLAKQTTEAWQEAGLPLIIADASPDSWVVDELADRGAIICPEPRPGLATQCIDSVSFALDNGAQKILRAEPEKVGLVPFAVEPIGSSLDNNDIVVVGRTVESMHSLPTYMATVEEVTALIFETFGFPADVMSGIRGYSKAGARLLTNYDVAEHGNGWMFLHEPVLRARKEGLNVAGLLIDLIYPQEVRDQEQDNPAFDMKRHHQSLLQLQWLLEQAGCEINFPAQ